LKGHNSRTVKNKYHPLSLTIDFPGSQQSNSHGLVKQTTWDGIDPGFPPTDNQEEPTLPQHVTFMGSQTGRVQDVQFIDYDVCDPEQFPTLAFHHYACTIRSIDGNPLVLTQEWAHPLRQVGILPLIDCPHFGHSGIVTLCIHLLLTQIHGGYLWLGGKYLVDEATIHRVTGLPMQGDEPEKSLTAKDVSQQEIYDTYNAHHGRRGVLISEINALTSSLCYATHSLQNPMQLYQGRVPIRGCHCS
jgi:hypothetical protein